MYCVYKHNEYLYLCQQQAPDVRKVNFNSRALFMSSWRQRRVNYVVCSLQGRRKKVAIMEPSQNISKRQWTIKDVWQAAVVSEYDHNFHFI